MVVSAFIGFDWSLKSPGMCEGDDTGQAGLEDEVLQIQADAGC